MAIAERTSYSRYVATEQSESAAETKRELVKNLLAKLKESDRTVVTLYYFGEMTYEEIGEFLGMSADTVRMRVRRALQRLKRHEPMIREALGSFQLSPNLTENIMREIPRITPLSPTGGNPPVVPWAIAASTAILVVIMLGISNQYLARFQQPYSFDATSKMTVELIDVPIVVDISSKLDVRNQFGNSGIPGENNSTGKKLEDILKSHFNAIGGLARLSEIRNIQRFADGQLTQRNGKTMNESGRAEMVTVIGKKSYLKLDFGEPFTETTVWNGSEGWKSVMGNSPTTLPETEYEYARYETYINPLQGIYEELGSSAFQQDGDELFQGKVCSVVRIIDTENVFYIDKNSNLLVGGKTTYTGMDLKDVMLIFHYADYMDYEGVMLPNSYAIFTGDGTLSVNYTFTKTEINTALDPTIFQKP